MDKEQILAELKTWEGVNDHLTKKYKQMLKDLPEEKPEPVKVKPVVKKVEPVKVKPVVEEK